MRVPVLAYAIFLSLGAASHAPYLTNLPGGHPTIQYSLRPVNDPVARLNQQLQSGKAKLDSREGGLGYLPSLLEHLKVNTNSQALVFSKTSFQASRISPRNPRAIYFNDNVAVGWVRGSEGIEIAAVDPNQGVIFYTLSAGKQGQPEFTRQDLCLKCHQGPATAGVPGIFIGSVYPDSSGNPQHFGAIITDHRTPFADRWGGWYVNASHGEQRDRANAVAPNPAEPEVLQPEGKQNLASLEREFNTSGYLTPVSDIVALMTFEHQTQMTNLLTRLGWETRIAQDRVQIESDIEAIVTYMLFADEAPFQESIQGISTFASTFPERGPRDRLGRSLRDFDLHTRLFRYPLSYLVYSQSFDALPDIVRERIYKRLYDVLTGQDKSRIFANLSSNDRRSILAILRDTKTNLPEYWQSSGNP